MLRFVAMVAVVACLPLMAQSPPKPAKLKKEQPHLKKIDPLLRQIKALRKQLQILQKRLDALRKRVEGIMRRHAVERLLARRKHHPQKQHLRNLKPAHKQMLSAHRKRHKRILKRLLQPTRRYGRMRGMPPWLWERDGEMLRRFIRRKIFFRRVMMLRRFLRHMQQFFIKRLQERIRKMRRFKPRISPRDIRDGLGFFIRRMLQEKLRRRIPPTAPQAVWF